MSGLAARKVHTNVAGSPSFILYGLDGLDITSGLSIKIYSSDCYFSLLLMVKYIFRNVLSVHRSIILTVAFYKHAYSDEYFISRYKGTIPWINC